MTATRLDGKALAQRRRKRLAERVAALHERGIAPTLGVILPTEEGAATAYFRAKQRVAEKVGIEIVSAVLKRPTTAEIVEAIGGWARDPEISGILIETPLPPEINADAVRDALPVSKDVDGAGTEALGRLLSGQPAFPPATAAAALMLAESAGPLAGKRAVVIGRSLVVGRPLALLLLAEDATVTVCHSKTVNLLEMTRQAEVLFVAIGRAGFVTADMVAPGAVVVDIGISVVDGRLVGDVDHAAVEPIAGSLSPVPGGVGPLTSTMVLEHVVDAAQRAAGTAAAT